MDETTFEAIRDSVPKLTPVQFAELLKTCTLYATEHSTSMLCGRFDPAWVVAANSLKQATSEVEYRLKNL